MKTHCTRKKRFALTLITMFCMLMLLRQPAQAETTQEYVFHYLVNNLEICPAAACGVMANMGLESGFIPAIRSSAGALGLCQWAGVRRGWLINYCSSNGYNYETAEGQLHYLEHELHTYFPDVLSSLRQLPNTAAGAYNAGYIWCMKYESGGNPVSLGNYRASVASGTYWPQYGANALYLYLTSAAGSIKLEWSGKSSGGFEIYRSTKKNSGFQLLASIFEDAHTYKDTTAERYKKYYYKVVSLDKKGKEKETSNILEATADRSLRDHACEITIEEGRWVYTGKAIEPKVTVTYDGTKLHEKKQYEVTYSSNVNAGKAKITITGKGKYSGTVKKTFTINKASRRIRVKDISLLWKGKTVLKPEIRAAHDDDMRYTLRSSNRSAVRVSGKELKVIGCGEATITVSVKKAKNYAAETVTFTVSACPERQKIVSAQSTAEGCLHVQWKRDRNASGYEIVCSETEDFAEPVKTVEVSGYRSDRADIAELPAQKTLFVKVRSIGGKGTQHSYGKWSKTVQIAVK